MASLASLALGTAPGGRSLATVPGQVDPYATPIGIGNGPAHPSGMGQPIVNGTTMADATAAAATPAAAAAPTAPHLTDYAAQYEQSLAASRAGIEHQLASALADINAKEAGARQAVGTLPGSLSTIYGTGDTGLAATAASLDAAQHAAGLQSYMGAGAQLAPIHAALAGDLAARQADVPLLNIGLAQQALAEHSALGQARLSAFDQLDQQQRTFLAQQMDAQRQAAAIQAAHEFASNEQTHSADLSLRNAIAMSGVKTPEVSYGNLVTPAAGLQMQTTDPQHVAALRSSPAYANVVASLRAMGAAKVGAMQNNPAWLQGYMSGNASYGGTGATLSPQAMSLALFDAGYKP